MRGAPPARTGEPVGCAVRGGGSGRDRALASRPHRTRPFDRSALVLRRETSVASAEALIRALPAKAVVLACFEVASTNRRWPEAEITHPEKVRWVGSRRTAWLGACLLARAPKPPVCELRNRLRDR